MQAPVQRFLEPLDVRFVDGRFWLLLTSFEYRLKDDSEGSEYVRVGAGFKTDFASIPRGLWNLWPPAGAYAPAALVHDCLYKTAYVVKMDGTTRTIDRAEADHILLDAMQVLGIGWFTRRSIYLGVRLGGFVAWNKHRQFEIQASI